MGYDEKVVNAITRKIKLSQYKRKLPVIVNVSKRGMGNNFKFSRDWGM